VSGKYRGRDQALAEIMAKDEDIASLKGKLEEAEMLRKRLTIPSRRYLVLLLENYIIIITMIIP
jgi:hypothetical protein